MIMKKFKLKKDQTTLTTEQEALVDKLYDEAMDEVKNLYKMWDDKNVQKEMKWFMSEILQEEFKVAIAKSPMDAQRMAQKITKTKDYFEPLSYPWFSDRSFIKHYKFGTYFEEIYDDNKEEVKLLFRYEKFINSGIYQIVAVKGHLIVSKPFMYHKTDEDGRLHSIDSPCVEFDDGYKEYAILGVFFEEKEWKKIVNKKITKEEIFAEKNTDRRMAILSVYGSDWLLESCNAEKLDHIDMKNNKDHPTWYTSEHGDWYELYKIKQDEGVFEQDRYFLKYPCPSTGRIYVEAVPNEFGEKGALASIAWKFEASVEDFLNMKIHA